MIFLCIISTYLQIKFHCNHPSNSGRNRLNLKIILILNTSVYLLINVIVLYQQNESPRFYFFIVLILIFFLSIFLVHFCSFSYKHFRNQFLRFFQIALFHLSYNVRANFSAVVEGTLKMSDKVGVDMQSKIFIFRFKF